jgi:leucyl-tRNA synthetase
LAVLYAASPQKSLNWSDSAVLRCSRFLAQVWEYSHRMLERQQSAAGHDDDHAQPSAVAGEDEAAVRDSTEHLRLKLEQWCEAGVGRITKDMESLEMHSAVRNVMRLFDRIKDFDKRVVAREGELRGANLDASIEALTVLAQTLGPFAPHLAEELWIAFGRDEHAAQTPWPGVSLEVSA